MRTLLALEHTQVPIEALFFERVELSGEVRERVLAHDSDG
jgi:hypothetical protein